MKNKTTATQTQEYIDLTPTPDGMAKIMYALIESGDSQGKATALKEIAKAFRIAYAYWYPEKPEYHIDGISGKAVKS
jgi:transcriptional regulator with XRE-family HTH domain